jgi:uncharacterized membrane protein AbrB (regulator of aidB expression)
LPLGTPFAVVLVVVVEVRDLMLRREKEEVVFRVVGVLVGVAVREANVSDSWELAKPRREERLFMDDEWCWW